MYLFQFAEKPSNLNLFLGRFVEDLNDVQRNGIEVHGRTVEVRVRLVLADSPARSFLKRKISVQLELFFCLTISFFFLLSDCAYYNAKNGCMKCLVKGKYYDGVGVVFPSFNDESRTDEGFRSGQYGAYHHGETPLTEIDGLDMILDFPVCDVLHLIDLGNTKRWLKGWIERLCVQEYDSVDR